MTKLPPWTITAIGILGGVYMSVEPLITTGNVNWHEVTKGAIVAFLGILSKQFNITGGSVRNNQSPKGL